MTLVRTKAAPRPRRRAKREVRAEAAPQNEADDVTIAIAPRHLSIIFGLLALGRSSFWKLLSASFDLGSYWYGAAL